MVMKVYEKERVSINILKTNLDKIDKIKECPRWKGNRSEVIEYIIEYFFKNKK